MSFYFVQFKCENPISFAKSDWVVSEIRHPNVQSFVFFTVAKKGINLNSH